MITWHQKDAYICDRIKQKISLLVDIFSFYDSPQFHLTLGIALIEALVAFIQVEGILLNVPIDGRECLSLSLLVVVSVCMGSAHAAGRKESNSPFQHQTLSDFIRRPHVFNRKSELRPSLKHR